VVKGVKYLHCYNIAHGDIEAVSTLTFVKDPAVKLVCSQPNILILDSTPPRAMLSDFGSIRITTTPVGVSSEVQATASFMAPELLFPADFGLDKGVPSKEADIYALGMTVYQVLTGKWPFFPRREEEVMLAVTSGKRPPKPKNAEGIGMTGVVWDLLRECWKEDRTARPTIGQVLERFHEITGEKKATDSTLQGFATPESSPRKRSPVFSQNWSPMVLCEWGHLCSLLTSSPVTEYARYPSPPCLGYGRGAFGVPRHHSFEPL